MAGCVGDQSISQPRSPWLAISSPSCSASSVTRIGTSSAAPLAQRKVATAVQNIVTPTASACAAKPCAASACAAIGREIGGAIGACDEALLGGGGVRNRALVGAIASAAPGVRVRTTDELGVPAPFRESVAMAVLGALCADGVAITLPAVTGVAEPAPIAGVWAGLEHFVCTPSVQTR